MNIKFKYVKLNNFLSFQEAELKLDNLGYITIQGRNDNPADMALSNGSGKSSITESIAWCLSGETIRGSKDVANRFSEGTTKVELWFDAGKDSYHIIRTKNPSGLKVFINDEDRSGKGIRDTQQLLDEYLPDLNAQVIGSVIILGQGLPQRFTNNTPSGRKEVLEKLSKSDYMIEDVKSKISKRAAALKSNIRSREDEKLSSTTMLSMTMSRIESTKKSLENLPNRVDLETAIELLDSNILDCKIKLNDWNNALEQCNISKSQLDAQLDTATQKLDLAVLEVKNRWEDEIRDLESTKIQLTTNLNQVKKQIKDIRNIKDVCPTCGQRLPNVYKPDTTELEKEESEIQLQLKELEQNISSKRDVCSEELYMIRDQHEAAVLDIRMRADRDAQSIRELKGSIDLFTHKLQEYQNDRLKRQAELDVLDARNQEYQKLIVDSENEAASLNKNITAISAELLDLQNHLDIVNKMSSIATRDFRGYLLSNIIDYIDLRAKEYSMEVFGVESISFILDGNNIVIRYDDKDYENLSGGEKQKIDLIIQLALRDMLCTYLNFSSNILMVDELFDGLDYLGCQQVINLISHRLSDVEAIYIISHHADLGIPVDKEITVIKGADRISRIL